MCAETYLQVCVVGKTQILIQTGFANAIHTHKMDSDSVVPSKEFDSKEFMLLALQDQQDCLENTWKFIKHNQSPTDTIFKPQNPINHDWFKQLHSQLTRNQQYIIATDMEEKTHRFNLNHGIFKSEPNSPTTALGFRFEYCPPNLVDSEMLKLYEYLAQVISNPEIPSEVAAAWVHYAYVCIHPFEDGNGRISRFLASLVFMKAGLVPLLIENSDTYAYFNALKIADQDGNLQPLVDFFAYMQCRLINMLLSTMPFESSVEPNFSDNITLVTPIIEAHLQEMVNQFQQQIPSGESALPSTKFKDLNILLALNRSFQYSSLREVLKTFNAHFTFTPGTIII
jgi:hypothetical protein